jgi:RNA polymerase sigma-70 factor (ECF subfamily)
MVAAQISVPMSKGGVAGLSFAACYEGHRRHVYQWCLRYGGGNASFAEDVTHDVFVKLLEHIDELDNPGDLGGWLYRVAANLSVSRLRRTKSILARFLPAYRAEIDGSQAPPDLLFEQREAAAAAMTTLRTLPGRERVVMVMKLLDGKSQREIAEALSVTEGYVSKLYARAWERIRAAGWEDDDERT